MPQRRHTELGVGGTVVGVIAAILALAVSVWTGRQILSSCVEWVQLRDAVAVDAKVLEIERRIVSGVDASTEHIYVRYEYEYEGEKYEQFTRRLALFDMSNDLQASAVSAFESGETIRCWVDPDSPSLSVLSLSFSAPLLAVSLLFPLLFGGAGVCILYGLARSNILRRSMRARS